MMKKYLIILSVFMITGVAKAQQLPNLMHYFENPAFINPSFTGHSGYSEAYLLYKKLLVGIPGTFETQFFNVHTFIPKYRLGVGFRLNNDINNFIGHTRSSFDVSYKIPLDEQHAISFGLSPTFSFHRIHFDRLKADNPYESVILERAENTSIFDADFGFNYRNKNLTLGFAAMQLFNKNAILQTEEKERNIYYRHLRHFHLGIQYRYTIGASPWAFEPGAFLFSPQGQASLMALSGKAYYKDVAWVSGHYVHEASIGLKTGFRVDDQFIMSYFFEVPTTPLRELGNLSHEIMIGFQFGKSKRDETQNQLTKKLKEVKEQKLATELERLSTQDTVAYTTLQEKIDAVKTQQQQSYDMVNTEYVPSDSAQIRQLVLQELQKYREENQKNKEAIESIELVADSLPGNYEIQKEIYLLRKENQNQSKLIEQLINKSDSMARYITSYQQSLNDLDMVIRDIQLSLEDSLSPQNITSGNYEVIGGFQTLKYAKIYQREVKREFGINSAVVKALKDKKEFFIVYAVKNELLIENEKDLEVFRRRYLLYEMHKFEPNQFKE